MTKTSRMLSIIMALVLCFSLGIPLFASAAESNTDQDNGYQYVIATNTPNDESSLLPRVDFESNGQGILHFNDLFDSAYAETEKWDWIQATYMFAKVTIGQRNRVASYNGNKKSIRTETLYAAAGEKIARGNHTITSTTNGTQYYNTSHYF